MNKISTTVSLLQGGLCQFLKHLKWHETNCIGPTCRAIHIRAILDETCSYYHMFTHMIWLPYYNLSNIHKRRRVTGKKKAEIRSGTNALR